MLLVGSLSTRPFLLSFWLGAFQLQQNLKHTIQGTVCMLSSVPTVGLSKREGVLPISRVYSVVYGHSNSDSANQVGHDFLIVARNSRELKD